MELSGRCLLIDYYLYLAAATLSNYGFAVENSVKEARDWLTDFFREEQNGILLAGLRPRDNISSRSLRDEKEGALDDQWMTNGP